MLSLAFILKGLVEIGLMFLLGQAVLWMFLLLAKEEQRQNNFVYSLFTVINKPLIAMARFLAPKAISPAHLGLYAFGLLWALYIGLLLVGIPELCSQAGMSLHDCKIGR